jgi:acyl-[acyl-carrier-protein]-phospholipid O-acyltransferase/long-chain-fatty-acid--[acyl-carrier-protein] ligase
MQTMAVQSHACKPIFECFIDAVAAHGRGAQIMEDQGDQWHTYGEILRMILALSRLLRRHTSDRENIGVLLPNMVSGVVGDEACSRDI